MKKNAQKNIKTKTSTMGLALLAMGIVFGDIGTSPLYALQATFSPSNGIPLTLQNILGGCSSVFWVLMLIVTLKYVTFILRATNKGEGGIMAMLALASSSIRGKPKLCSTLMFLGLLGTALFFGDAVITPAISVLSAVEGLKIGSVVFESYTLLIAIIIILGLFIFQRYGSSAIGHFFGPICLVWFLSIAGIGLYNIIHTPIILYAFNPIYAIEFLTTHGYASFLVIGTVLLAYTGAEALYADVGHFGQKAIKLAWYMIFPALILNYFGQGAILIENPAAVFNPFYLACPPWTLYPMVIIATLATIIASQAVISGAYSITWQAIQLHYLPRMTVYHTSAQEIGQIYIPVVNWVLLMAVLMTMIGFGTAENLSSAYGIAVSGTMLTTTLLAFFVVYYDWKYPLWLSAGIIFFFGTIDLIFFSASLLKLDHGGWFPLAIALFMLVIMRTWRAGRDVVLSARSKQSTEDLSGFLEKLLPTLSHRVPGAAVFFNQESNTVPHTLGYNLTHNKIFHERVVFLTLSDEDIPHVSQKERINITHIQDGCYSLTLRFGFKDVPNIPRALRFFSELSAKREYAFLENELSYFLSYETLVINPLSRKMMPWRKHLFSFLVRNQRNVSEFFHLPSESVIQLGSQIEI